MSFTKEGFRQFHAATHACFDVLLDHLGRMPPELLVTDVAGFGRATIRDQLVHALSTELVWVQGLKMQPIERLRPESFETVESIRTAKHTVAAHTREYLDSLPNDKLNAELERLPDDWIGPPRSPAFILLHVLTHTFHHKGQIVAMLRLLGHPAPDTDLQRDVTH